MRIGILFGGQSREREIAFAGGRTVYDNLNKELFEPVPVFIDSLGNFIHLNWQYIYKGSIRDFYPPLSVQPESPNHFQIYIESLGDLTTEEQEYIIRQVGTPVKPSELPEMMDFAFLALHGPFGEDGNIQGILEWYNIPYSGSGILASAIGINKQVQRPLLENAGFNRPKDTSVHKEKWLSATSTQELLENLEKTLGLPFVVKSPHQGSSIGVSVIDKKDPEAFMRAMDQSFFLHRILPEEWNKQEQADKAEYIRVLCDIRTGIGLPVISNNKTFYHPEHVLNHVEEHCRTQSGPLLLESIHSEEEVLIEAFISGKEFSCIVIRDEDNKPIALPPTQIIKGSNVFDYRSKYLPGMSRKITPIDMPDDAIRDICNACEHLFESMFFNVYARIDGFIDSGNRIYLNDPNTTSGMLPSSFFFHQAAEIGLNPSQFLTYIIRTSVQERIKSGKNTFRLKQTLSRLDSDILSLHDNQEEKTQVAVILGGYSSERHISVESGRNIYEKLASSSRYEPVPVFLTGDDDNIEMYVIPVNILLKDNADDIRDKILKHEHEEHPVIREIQDMSNAITGKYVKNIVKHPYPVDFDDLQTNFDAVFIGLHGRPGEDGTIQKELEKRAVPYNGSGPEASSLTIDKFRTNEYLKEQGFHVAPHKLIHEEEWEQNQEASLNSIEQEFSYPFIAKPSDDGCSSAVKVIRNREELKAYARLIFREKPELDEQDAVTLHLSLQEEFSMKDCFLIEQFIQADDAARFLEITGGLVTHYDKDGGIVHEMFEPSEALSSGEVLSLEEKFLAGEGQNLTPARFADDPDANEAVSEKVKTVLRQVAETLNLQGYARIDAFVKVFPDQSIEVIIIEVNSLPGMTPATAIFHQCALNNYKPFEFVDAILSFGMQRNQKKLTETL